MCLSKPPAMPDVKPPAPPPPPPDEGAAYNQGIAKGINEVKRSKNKLRIDLKDEDLKKAMSGLSKFGGM